MPLQSANAFKGELHELEWLTEVIGKTRTNSRDTKFMMQRAKMKKWIILTALLMVNSAQSGENTINAKYLALIERLENSCAGLKPYWIPESIEQMFCSQELNDQIAVRYCLYQNLINSDNNQVLQFEYPSGSTGTKSSSHTVEYRCKGMISPEDLKL